MPKRYLCVEQNRPSVLNLDELKALFQTFVDKECNSIKFPAGMSLTECKKLIQAFSSLPQHITTFTFQGHVHYDSAWKKEPFQHLFKNLPPQINTIHLYKNTVDIVKRPLNGSKEMAYKSTEQFNLLEFLPDSVKHLSYLGTYALKNIEAQTLSDMRAALPKIQTVTFTTAALADMSENNKLLLHDVFPKILYLTATQCNYNQPILPVLEKGLKSFAPYLILLSLIQFRLKEQEVKKFGELPNELFLKIACHLLALHTGECIKPKHEKQVVGLSSFFNNPLENASDELNQKNRSLT